MCHFEGDSEWRGVRKVPVTPLSMGVWDISTVCGLGQDGAWGVHLHLEWSRVLPCGETQKRVIWRLRFLSILR